MGNISLPNTVLGVKSIGPLARPGRLEQAHITRSRMTRHPAFQSSCWLNFQLLRGWCQLELRLL
eukprot:503474-Alexandrium_andersonii.AAC.1